MKNPWSDRWSFVKSYIPPGSSIVDFGCGNKEVLDYCTPTKYLGIDQLPTADVVADLDQPLNLNDHYDLGLLLGVLEYTKNPNTVLENIVRYADRFIILTLPVKKKPEWARAFTKQTINELLNKHFKSVQHYEHGRYILSIGTA